MIPSPDCWKFLVMWCLLKSSDASTIDDLRPIVILPAILKLYMLSLLTLVRPYLVYQCDSVGARKGYQAQDAIHTLRQIAEKCQMFHLPLIVFPKRNLVLGDTTKDQRES